MFKFAAQGSVVTMEFEGGLSSVVCVAVTPAMAESIVQALIATQDNA